MPSYVKLIPFAFLSVVLLESTVHAQSQSKSQPLCDNVVTTLFSRYAAKTPLEDLQRVEIRSCSDRGETIQIAAWGSGETAPSLVEETYSSTTTKIASARNVFVIETPAGSASVIRVIIFEEGRPRLALSEAIKAYARIEMGWKKVIVGLPQPDGTEKAFEFSTGTN